MSTATVTRQENFSYSGIHGNIVSIHMTFYYQNGNLACGGLYTNDTCLQLVEGDWITSHHLKISRYDHTSWTTSEGTLLVGGSDSTLLSSFYTTELVKTDGTTEVGTLTLTYPSA